MKKNLLFVLAALTFSVALIVGSKLYERHADAALLASVQKTWSMVEGSIAMGIAVASSRGEIGDDDARLLSYTRTTMGLAVKNDARGHFTVLWRDLEPMARRGAKALVDDFGGSPSTAAFLTGKINYFQESLATLAKNR